MNNSGTEMAMIMRLEQFIIILSEVAKKWNFRDKLKDSLLKIQW